MDATTLPAGFGLTTTGAGDAALHSNGSPASVTLVANDSSDPSIDIGYKGTGSLTGSVWFDADVGVIVTPASWVSPT